MSVRLFLSILWVGQAVAAAGVGAHRGVPARPFLGAQSARTTEGLFAAARAAATGAASAERVEALIASRPAARTRRRPSAPLLRAEPASFAGSMLDEVTVSWAAAGALRWQEGDRLALYCPLQAIPNGELATTALDVIALAPNQTSVTVRRLVNMRCEYEFVYVRLDGPSWRPTFMYTAVASSNVVTPLDADEPMHVHAAIEPGNGGLRVTWTTRRRETPPLRVLSLAAGVNVSAVASRTYAASDLCTAPANLTVQAFFRDPGWIHSVVVQGAPPASTLEYAIGASGPFALRVPPTTGAPGKAVFFADVAVDVGDRAQATVARTLADPDVGLVLLGGDTSYSMGFAWAWEYFMTQIEPVASAIPYQVVVGNHELDWTGAKRGGGYHPSWGNFGDDSGGECGVPTLARFPSPTYWYSFDYSTMHVVSVSTEHDLAPGSAQYEWLERDLAETTQPFVVVQGHRPLYVNKRDADRVVGEHLRAYLEPLFEKYGVDLYLTGHVHLYSRSCAGLLRGECGQPRGTTHVTVGTAGADLVSVAAGEWEPWAAAHCDSAFGTLQLAANASAIQCAFVLNSNGTALDSFTVPRRRGA